MYIRVNEEVKKALENNQPVVALESTIISHGMPRKLIHSRSVVQIF